MEEYQINPNKAMFLFDTGNGWEIAKLTDYKLQVCMDNISGNQCNYVIRHSLFYRSVVPEELLNKLINLIPTDEQLDDIEWCKKHQTNTINYGTELCQIEIKH